MTTESKELTLPERARQAIALKQTEKDLEELAAKSADVTEIKDPADYELVKRSALVLRAVRVEIQKAGKTARDDANAFRGAVIEEEARLVGIISPEENRLKALRQVEDDKVAEKLAEDRRIEEARVSELKNRIQAINNMTDGLVAADSGTIKERLETIENLLTTEDYFAELFQEATEAREAAADTLEAMLEERIQAEEKKAEADQLAEERRIEQERVDKEQADTQAALDRQAQELQDREDKAQEEQDARDAAADAERQEKERQAKEKRDAELAEERADAAAEKAERERLEEEIGIREEADRKAAEEEEERKRIAAAMPDIEKVEALARMLQGYVMPNLQDPKCAELAAIALEQVEEVGNQLLIDAGKLKGVSK